MTRMHFTASYFNEPQNPITVNLIGAGGTGSQVLTALGRMNHAMVALNHPGLQVTLWDNDTVSTANLGRQLFAQAEVGLAKSVALINRINRFFGTNWKAQHRMYSKADHYCAGVNGMANIIISCVDTVSARFEIADILNGLHMSDQQRDRPYYWLDFGNSQKTGQVILSTIGKVKQPDSRKYDPVDQLPLVTEEWGDALRQSEDSDDTPSCSLAEALAKQDLFINSTLANMGSALLWSLFRNGMTENRGFFLNLKDFRTVPVKV
ncbi:PRTRC system ThiF family protein [Spirosoma sp. SC4-14]|uniref:PRTRC system ThiF family protein n=1 Tax=Spirosoma sp. SC4-14 TaxID=3128900 RepID=UPI0030CC7D5B